MGLRRTVEPVLEPLDVAELSGDGHLRISVGQETEYVTGLLVAAREVAEGDLHRALLSQTWVWTRDAFPAAGQVLSVPYPPLQAVSEIRYYDVAGVLTLLSPTIYTVDVDSTPGRIALAPDQSWPDTQARLGAVRITFLAGWTDPALVPARIKQGMLLLVGSWYEHRESVVVGTITTDVKDTLDRLWEPIRMYDF